MNVNRFFKRSKIDFENFSQKYYCWKIVREENCLHVWNTEREILYGPFKIRLKRFDSKILFDSKKYYFESVDIMINPFVPARVKSSRFRTVHAWTFLVKTFYPFPLKMKMFPPTDFYDETTKMSANIFYID